MSPITEKFVLSLETKNETTNHTFQLGRQEGYDVDVDMMEVIAFVTKPTLATIEKIEGYLAKKWGISGTFIDVEIEGNAYRVDGGRTVTVSAIEDKSDHDVSIGYSTVGNFVINNSRFTAESLTLAGNINSEASLTLIGNNADIDVSEEVVLGKRGNATIYHNGGTLTGTTVQLAQEETANTIYHLNGGTLEATNVQVGSGNATIMMNGGLLDVDNLNVTKVKVG